MRSQNLTLEKIDKVRSMPVLEGIAIGALMLMSIGASASYLYFQAVDAVKAEIEEGIQRSTASVAAMIEGDQHEKFVSKAQKFDPEYLKYVAPLERARQASKYVPYIYTNILKDDKVYFIVNPSPQLDLNKDGFPDDAPDLMDSYDAPSQSLLTALTQQTETVDKEPYTDEWGTFISAYSPIYNSRGGFVGTLGMDLDYSGFEKRLIPTKNAFKTASITGVVMAILVGVTVWFNRRTVKLLNKSRVGIITKYVRANEYVKSTNQYRSNLLTYITRSLAQLPAGMQSVVFEKLNLIAAMERENIESEKSNFNLADHLQSLLVKQGLAGSVSVAIAKDVPAQINGNISFFSDAFAHLLPCLSVLGLASIDVKLLKESINFVLISMTLSGKKESVAPAALAEFYQRLVAFDDPDEKPLIQHPDHLLPAVAYNILTQMGATIELAHTDPTLFSFSLKFAKFSEAEGELAHA